MRFVFQFVLAFPIMVVIDMAIPQATSLYQALSIGIVASMISGAWIKYVDE